MDEMPKTTLTQKRSQMSSGSSKLQKDKLDHSVDVPSEKSKVIRIILWITIIVFVGVAAAILVVQFDNGSLNFGGNTETAEDQEDTDSEGETVDSLPDAGTETDETDGTETDTDTTEEEVTDVVDENTEDEPEEVVEESVEDNNSSEVLATNIDEYATTNRARVGGTTNNTILNTFAFQETATEFNYRFTDVATSGGTLDPDFSLTYEGNNLVLTFNNLASDRVTGPNNSTSRQLTSITKIEKTETENTGETSTYTFFMEEKFPARVIFNPDTREILLQIDNR
jgi:hypothetical protein